jgi:UDP-N-acetylglucosamine--N-acetylmuramyl-(pentapeptide) pyrophosphoryl-undecaprenol N-acetylglucosamine transferase
MSKRILLVGGGSGGHVFPLMAVAEALRAIDPNVELMVLGSGPFLAEAATTAGLSFKTIQASGLRRYFSFRTLLTPFQIIIGFFQSLWILFSYMPDVMFTKGGYASVAPALVAKLYFISIYTHESDSTPGLANRFISKLARVVFTSFESTTKYFNPPAGGGKAVLVGNPVRPELLIGDKATALQQFNFRADRKTILIVGGSQGSKRINEAILEALIQLVNPATGGFQIIHQCGESQLAVVKATVEQYTKEGEKSYGPMISANYRLYPSLALKIWAWLMPSPILLSLGAGHQICSKFPLLASPRLLSRFPRPRAEATKLIMPWNFKNMARSSSKKPTSLPTLSSIKSKSFLSRLATPK